jgi:predicted ribosomally synthesized peptide with nif11-like leader
VTEFQRSAMKGELYAVSAMSEDQLSALLAKLKEDAGLVEKFTSAADLDTALAIAKEAGFDVSKADLLNSQARETLELTDEQLEGVAGGGGGSIWVVTDKPDGCCLGSTGSRAFGC